MNLIAYDGQIEIDDDDWLDADESRVPDDDEDEWECEFGVDCLMPSFYHRRSECYTVEMAQDWQHEHPPESERE